MIPLTVRTIGHSTRSADELLEILRAHGVGLLVDVRAIPHSRHCPQFDREKIAAFLRERGVAYAHLPELGGRRRVTRDSPNGGWSNPSFRGYADHMRTPEFARGMAALLELAARGPTAIMCAEALPSRCHRSLIGDALEVRGVEVVDLLDAQQARPHVFTPWARVEGLEIVYPPQPELPFDSG